MPKVYIIAGPPGIGKSTSGASMVPNEITILDPDLIANRYKKQGFADYKDVGNFKFDNLVRKELFAGDDFAIELNLGYDIHYDFVKSIKNFNSEISLHVILFYTDDIEICYQRANARHLAGLHLVSPKVIKEMYDNTIPLLHKNFALIDSLEVINITGSIRPQHCLQFDKSTNKLITSIDIPEWATTSIKDFIHQQNSQSKAVNTEQQKITKPNKPKNRPKLR